MIVPSSKQKGSLTYLNRCSLKSVVFRVGNLTISALDSFHNNSINAWSILLQGQTNCCNEMLEALTLGLLHYASYLKGNTRLC